MNFYEVLGVAHDASPEEIKQAHRKAVRECHPDVIGHSGAETRLRKINAAWAVLNDPARRTEYNLALQRGQATGPLKQTVNMAMSDQDLMRVVIRTKENQDKRTREMVRFGIIGVGACLVLLIFLSGFGG